MPTVSVIIPTHSRPHFLPRAVQSVIAASEPAPNHLRTADLQVEVIIVDDASTDTTAHVGQELQTCQQLSQDQPRAATVRYVRLQKNVGVAGARNAGLRASRGEFIAFLDDDDLRLPHSLHHQIEILLRNPQAGMICSGILAGDENAEPTGRVRCPRQQSGDVFWDMLALAVVVLPISVIVRRECFARTGFFDQTLRGIDDWDMWTRISASYPVLIEQTPVAIYREPAPDSGQGSSDFSRHLSRAAHHQKRLLQLPRARAAKPEQRAQVRRRHLEIIAVSLIRSAWKWLAQGDSRYAQANLLAALRLNPFYAAVRPSTFIVLLLSPWVGLKRRALRNKAENV